MKTARPVAARRGAPVKPRSQNPAPRRTSAALPAGQSLDPATRSLMESRLGHAFDGVQVHTGPDAAESARALNARAYSVGRHIVFDEGQYRPWSADGQRLLAHELAHVAQPVAPGRVMSQRGDAGEREADAAAGAVAAGRPAVVGRAAGAAIQRQEYPTVMSGTVAPPSPDALIENAGPLLAGALGSATLDNFDTGKAIIKREHERQITSVARNVEILLRKYGTSTLEVTGFADTVGEEAKNLTLGQDRADAVKQELIKRGVPEGIITASSRGEGGPQAVPTKNEVPSAANRRVEIRFHPGKSRPGILGGTLTPPGSQPGTKQGGSGGGIDITKQKPVDVCRPPFRCPGPDELPPDIYRPIPPLPKGAGPKSVVDVVSEKIVNPVIDTVAGWLPKDKRDWLKEKGRDAVESGIPAGAKAAAQAVGVTDAESLQAIEQAVEAAIKEKGEQRTAPADTPQTRRAPEPKTPEF